MGPEPKIVVIEAQTFAQKITNNLTLVLLSWLRPWASFFRISHYSTENLKLASHWAVTGDMSYSDSQFNFAKLILTLSLGFFLSGCGSTVSSGGSSTSSSSNSSVSTVGSPFYVTVTTTPENSTTAVPQGSCIIAAGTSPSAVPLNCTISVPELDLFYSSVNMTVGTASTGTCTIISFSPYSFLKSSSSSYASDTTNSATTTDCSTTPRNSACFGGPAKDIITGFPVNGGKYFLTAASLASGFTLTAPNTQRQARPGDKNAQNNAYLTNDYPMASRGTAISNAAVDYAGGYSDYNFSCEDDWGSKLYAITLTLTTSKSTPNPTPLECDPSTLGCKFWHWNNSF